MWRGPVLPEENSLPSAKLHPTRGHGDYFTGAGESHFDMTRHIVGPFERVVKIWVVFRHETIEPPLEITTGRRISVLHDNQATACVLAENRDGAGRHTTRCHNIRNLSGNFNCPGSSR